MPLNTDHRLSAEQLFLPDEKKKKREAAKKTEKREIREMKEVKNESKIVKTKGA